MQHEAPFLTPIGTSPDIEDADAAGGVQGDIVPDASRQQAR